MGEGGGSMSFNIQHSKLSENNNKQLTYALCRLLDVAESDGRFLKAAAI